MEGPLENDNCSICLGGFDLPCQANCSHWFCGGWIIEFWIRKVDVTSPCSCPLCRRSITLLIPAVTDGDADNPILPQIRLYNCRFGGRRRNLVEIIRDVPFLLRRLYPELVDPLGSLPSFIKARIYIQIVLGVAYILRTNDIIPDGILGIVGFLDDFLIAATYILSIAALYRSVLYNRHRGA